MKHLQFRNGDTAHAIGLGTWKAKGETVKNAIKEAVRAGYRHIDTAAIYDNETDIGEAIQELIKEGTITRDQLFITSKLWNNAHKSEDVLPALNESLKKLQLDYLDLYLIHWPVAFKKEEIFPQDASGYVSLSEVPILETWTQMEKAKESHLAKHIGVSNFSKKKLDALVNVAKEQPEMNQVELHPLLQQNDLYEYCQSKNVLLTAYSPLGSGDRSAEMKAANEPNLFEIPTIKSIANKHKVHPAKVLLNWHVQRGTGVIPKSTTPKNIKANYEAAELELDQDDMDSIARLDMNYRFINGKFFELPGNGYENIYDE